MLGSWALVLAVLGGVCALPAPAPLTYTQALSQAVDSYNQQPELKNTYRLLSSNPEPSTDIDLSTLQRVNFSMMETECAPNSHLNPDDCDFKENGARRRRRRVIKECSGVVQFLQDTPELDLSCTDASSNPVLVQRGRFGRFLRRIRRIRPRINFNVQARGSISLG
ncbi:CTHL2 protein, partial [Alcedo cyanopectus]|nr:CTHL2 protein [Ceyx cyanopectus]